MHAFAVFAVSRRLTPSSFVENAGKVRTSLPPNSQDFWLRISKSEHSSIARCNFLFCFLTTYVHGIVYGLSIDASVEQVWRERNVSAENAIMLAEAASVSIGRFHLRLLWYSHCRLDNWAAEAHSLRTTSWRKTSILMQGGRAANRRLVLLLALQPCTANRSYSTIPVNPKRDSFRACHLGQTETEVTSAALHNLLLPSGEFNCVN